NNSSDTEDCDDSERLVIDLGGLADADDTKQNEVASPKKTTINTQQQQQQQHQQQQQQQLQQNLDSSINSSKNHGVAYLTAKKSSKMSLAAADLQRGQLFRSRDDVRERESAAAEQMHQDEDQEELNWPAHFLNYD
ncbi:hypothetical protein HELRODRAFT_184787, partial [Helobdella robusta]|uniref:Uncharacterized protein n=1 Tax=Helobdella robusta TaxID=6412 RepID=T1FLZ9_HELRO